MVTVLDAFARIIHARVRNAAIPGKLDSISTCEFVDERHFHADESGSLSEESLTSRVEEPEATRLWPRRESTSGIARWSLGAMELRHAMEQKKANDPVKASVART